MTSDLLFGKELNAQQRSLYRALEQLPDTFSTPVSNLRSALRHVMIDHLNFELTTADARGLDAQIDGQVIAARNGFEVIHLHMARLRRSDERRAVERVSRQHPLSLIVTSSRDQADRGVWHFINLDEAGQHRKVLRRATVEPPFVGRTVLETLWNCKVDASKTALEIEVAHKRAFDVDRVTEDFYQDYKRVFDVLVHDLEGQTSHANAHAFALQLLNRMMFLYFIQRKRRLAPSGDRIWWLSNDRDFLLGLWRRYRRTDGGGDAFYSEWLTPLFFMAFNKNYGFHSLGLPQDVKAEFANLPYLNGGLFARSPVDQVGLTVRDEHFDRMFRELFERYNFTIREDTPLDVEVAVDPEMLGKVYESLVIREERGQAGIFYTPRVELDFMCRRALLEHLVTHTSASRADLISLVMNAGLDEELAFHDPEDKVLQALEKVAVVDPACGSGAFLVGMMEVLMDLLELLYRQKQQSFDRFQKKKQIISNNLYGVDIKDWAIRVAELRLWLSLVIETEEAGLDVTRPLLPNLSFRMRVGDSLVEEIAGQQLALRALTVGLGARTLTMVRDLSRKKADYFRGERDVTADEIRRSEQELLRKLLEDRADELSREIARLQSAEEGSRATRSLEGFSQVSARGTSASALRTSNRRSELEQERERIRSALRHESAERPFLWEVDFAEVFYRPDDSPGGFDIVIGNRLTFAMRTLFLYHCGLRKHRKGRFGRHTKPSSTSPSRNFGGRYLSTAPVTTSCTSTSVAYRC